LQPSVSAIQVAAALPLVVVVAAHAEGLVESMCLMYVLANSMTYIIQNQKNSNQTYGIKFWLYFKSQTIHRLFPLHPLLRDVNIAQQLKGRF
jgi:hypothetical protein